MDFLPTVCGLAGVPLPKDFPGSGEDVADVLKGKARPRTKPLFWEWRFNILGPTLNRSPMLANRDGNGKLLMNPDKSRVELYDLAKDRSEVDNVADRNPDVLERLSGPLLRWSRALPKGPVDDGAGKADYPWPRAGKQP